MGIMEFKSYRYIDGKAIWVISDENGLIIDKNPTKEQLKNVMQIDNIRRKKKNNRTCSRCGNIDTYVDKNGNSIWLRYLGKNKIWDGFSFICSRCNTHLWKHGYLSEEEIAEKRFEYFKIKRKKYFEGRLCCICGSYETWIRNGDTPCWFTHKCEKENCSGHVCGSCYYKSKSMLRNENFYLYDDRIKWLLGECVVCKTLRVKNRNIEEDDFRSITDSYRHFIYGDIEIKTLTLVEGRWNATFSSMNFDSVVILCMDNGWNTVKRSYIIPCTYIDGRMHISLYEYTAYIISKWEKFRIKEKEFDTNYQNLFLYLKDKEPFCLEDLKFWLEMDI